MKTQELHDGWIDDTEEWITDAAVAESSAKVLPPNTILVAMYGATVGQLGILRREMTCNQACSALVVDAERADFRFVFYQLLFTKPELKRLATGAAQQNLSGVLIKSLRLPFPPLAEQCAIAHILGTLDDKIELNRRRSETLEAMARALFKSWFVDFDPVRAKQDGHWQRGQSLPGLPAHLYDLFPDRLVDSELGEIPEGWTVGKFGQLVRQIKEPVNPGESPTALFAHYSLPAYDAGQVPVNELGAAIKSNKWRVEPSTVLLSKLNPEIDRTWLVDVHGEASAVCSTEFLVLSARKPYTCGYVYALARSTGFRQQLESMVTGTSKSHQRAQPAAVMDMGVLVPAAPVLTAFDHATSGWLAQILASRRESRTLATLRDTLLPKLISGELRVQDAERFVARAT